ncbi:hypothetical protein OAJ52_06005 [Bacteroidia bacterium]|nr:hypothetical protein [Bacteroidia bacterium]
MVDEKTYHLINDYLNGDLQGTTLDIFKSRLKSEKDLRKAVSEQKVIIAALYTVREQELRDILKSDTKKTKVIGIGQYLKTAGLAAAAIAILMVAFFGIRPYITDRADTNTAQESKAKPQQTLEKPKPITEDSILIADNPAIETTTIDTQTLALLEPISLVEKTPEEEDAMEDSETLEENDISEMELENAVVPKKSTANAPSTSADLDVVVKSDQLLTSQSFVVTTISPIFKEENKDILQNDDAQSSTRYVKTNRGKEDVDAPEAEEYKVAYKNRSISVEYWNSVVNYTGYKYTGQKVQLYGIDQKAALKFKELDNRLYVQIKGAQYFLEKNNKYNRLIEVINPTLLKVLNE